MTEFAIAVGSFLAAHMIPALPPVRRRLVAVLGRRPYLAIYAALSIVLLGWVIHAAQNAESPLLWAPAGWQWQVPAVLMPFALWLIFAGLFEPNPLSVSLRATDGAPVQPAITRVSRHPALIGLLIWALAHIPPNGDLVAVTLFATMAALAAAGCLLLDRRRRRELGKARWHVLARDTSVVPFLALVARPVRFSWSRSMTLAALAAAATYALFLLWAHAALFGVSPRPPEGLPLL